MCWIDKCNGLPPYSLQNYTLFLEKLNNSHFFVQTFLFQMLTASGAISLRLPEQLVIPCVCPYLSLVIHIETIQDKHQGVVVPCEKTVRLVEQLGIPAYPVLDGIDQYDLVASFHNDCVNIICKSVVVVGQQDVVFSQIDRLGVWIHDEAFHVEYILWLSSRPLCPQ